MYLSRLFLNPRSHQVRNEIANPYEMHRTICRAFPNANYKVNESSGILFRLDISRQTQIPILLAQSLDEPDWSFLQKEYLLTEDSLPWDTPNPSYKSFAVKLLAGQTLAFRLRANPTKRLGKSAGEKHHQRIGIYDEDGQTRWLKRKLSQAGASLQGVQIVPQGKSAGWRKNGRDESTRKLTLQATLFDGLLQVTDPAALQAALQTGIGSGKGFGFGLLSLAPPRG